MKKTLLYMAVFALVVIPSVTMAAWYNPFSWFKKDTTAVITPTQTDVTTENIGTSSPAVIPAPKPVYTNNITVSDPKLQGQINTLIQQNTTLQTQLASLTNKYNALIIENASLKAVKSELSSVITSNGKGTYTVTNLSNSTIHLDSIVFDYLNSYSWSSDSTASHPDKIYTVNDSSAYIRIVSGDQDSGKVNPSILSQSYGNPVATLSYKFPRKVIILPNSTTTFSLSLSGYSIEPNLTAVNFDEKVTVDGLPL